MTTMGHWEYEYFQFGNPKADKELNNAITSYREGRPVVVFDKAGCHLHGEEFLKQMAALGKSLPDFSMDTTVIYGISREYFESSDWPEILEAARLVLFLRRDPNSLEDDDPGGMFGIGGKDSA
jgi:hypothetical protein